nr:hypothetical protein [Tanacetum cinerariifolium]
MLMVNLSSTDPVYDEAGASYDSDILSEMIVMHLILMLMRLPRAQTMLIVNLSSTDPVYEEAGASYDSDILSE